MILLYKYYQNQTVVLGLILCLLMWAITSTYFAFTNKKEVLLFERSDTGIIVLGDKSKLQIDIENCLNEFVGYFYSYTSSNYEKHMDSAIKLMDRSVLEEFAPKMNEKFKDVQKNWYMQSSMIKEINKVSEQSYEILLSVKKPLEDEDPVDYRLLIAVTEVKRTIVNPYGIKITGLEEKYD